MMTDEDKRILELKAKTVKAVRASYMRAADMRDWPSANALWNEYSRHLHEYRQIKRRTT